MTNRSDRSTDMPPASPQGLPKLCGADLELGNFILGAPGGGNTCADAAQALLHEIDGRVQMPQSQPEPRLEGGSDAGNAFEARGGYCGGYSWDDGGGRLSTSSGQYGTGRGYDARDWGRKFAATNGGCVYIDLDHLEVVTPEVRSAREHVAYTHAMFRVAHQAQLDANAKLPTGQKIQLLATNSDGRDHSWGTHLNFLMSRRAFENIHHRKMHHLLYLAAYQVSSIVFAGQGKVGSENGRRYAPFQISARADFFETLVGEQTTFRRPIVNARDEALCGTRLWASADDCAAETMARLHVIFYDNNLCHVAGLLKVGVLQIILAMIECEQIDTELILDDPVSAVVVWSHDPTLRTPAKTISGKKLTAVELQLLFFERAARFVEAGACDAVVPDAREILAVWHDTLVKLREVATTGNPDALTPLAPRLDWVLKLITLRRVLAQHSELNWRSPQVRHLDQIFGSLDPSEGLYWSYERDGLVETVVSEAEIERCVHEPPPDTRAWTRAMLLRRAKPRDVAYVDWDCVRFRLDGDGFGPRYRTVKLSNPLAGTRAECERAFTEHAALHDTLDMLGATEADDERDVYHGGWTGWSGASANPIVPRESRYPRGPLG